MEDYKIEKLIKTDEKSVRNFLIGYLKKKTGGRADYNIVDDALQEAKIRVFKRIASYNQEMSFKNWFFKIALNSMIDILTKENRIKSLSLDYIGEQTWGESYLNKNQSDSNISVFASAESLLNSSEVSDQARQALEIIRALPENLRVPLYLLEVEQMDYEEIAEKLGVAVPALRVRVCRAKKRAQELAASYGGN